MKWLVDFRGCAQELDLWIADSQMNDLLRAEARTRIAEVLAEDERMMLLKAATAANRAQHRGRQRAAALGAACYRPNPSGRPRNTVPASASAAQPARARHDLDAAIASATAAVAATLTTS